MTATDTANPEAAIRKYLLYLEDPTRLRDEAEIDQRRKAVEQAQDPIDKLKAIAELKRASDIDETPLREGFVNNAKAWADESGVPLSAFQDLKVADGVLREAGFDLPATRRRGRRSAASDGPQRAKAVPADDIKAWVVAQSDTFTLADVMASAGGSPATVRKAVEELVDTGQVAKLGPDPDWEGRGRAPIRYERT
jgi:hypothetical protein